MKREKKEKKKKMTKKKRLLVTLITVVSIILLAVLVAWIGVHIFLNSTESGPSPSGKHYKGQPAKKTETVCVDTDSAGKPNSVVVDAYIRNNTESAELVDKTNLTDIININGDEKYKKNKDGTITWPMKGNDVYYEGTSTTQDVPITMNVKYYLDGKKISGDKLKHKSGKLEIHIKYKNNKYVKINGKKVQVPFVVLSAMVVTNKSLSKIKISNGKVINQSGIKVAMGVSVPGLAKSAGMPAISKSFSGEVVIKGVAKNFKGNEIITMVSNDTFKYVSNKNLNKLNLDKKVITLDTSTKKIVAGSKKLSNGISLATEGTKELSKGTTKAKDASQKLADSTYKVLTELGKGSQALGLLSKGILVANIYMDQLINNPSAPSEGTLQLSKDVYEIADKINSDWDDSDVTDKGIEDMLKAVKDSDMTEGDKAKMNDYLEAMKTVESSRDELSDKSEKVSKNIGVLGQIFGGQKSGESLNPEWEKYLEESGYADELKRSDGTYMGLIEITELWVEKIELITSKLDTLANGKRSLAAGAKELAKGIRQIDSGAGKIKNGMKKLDSGSTALEKGMAKYYDKGIKKIVNMYNDNLLGVSDNLKAMKKADKKYNNYSGLTEGMDGSVTFMYFTPIGGW